MRIFFCVRADSGRTRNDGEREWLRQQRRLPRRRQRRLRPRRSPPRRSAEPAAGSASGPGTRITASCQHSVGAIAGATRPETRCSPVLSFQVPGQEKASRREASRKDVSHKIFRAREFTGSGKAKLPAIEWRAQPSFHSRRHTINCRIHAGHMRQSQN